jgi:hypothetical protein
MIKSHSFTFFKSIQFLIACISLLLCFFTFANTEKIEPKVQETETEFTFSGKCFNGKKYWLFASERIEGEKIISFFIYKGPVGSGTVRTDASPKVMVERICREKADIVDSF